MAAAFLSKDENTVLISTGRISSELPNNAASISLHASFFMQLQMFLIGFISGDCGENSILRLALFLNHVNTAMAL